MLLWDIRNTGQHCRGAIIFSCDTSFHPLEHPSSGMPPFHPSYGSNSGSPTEVAGGTND